MTAEDNKNEPQSKNGSIDIVLLQRDIVLLQKDIAQIHSKTAELQRENMLLQKEAVLLPQDIKYIKSEVTEINDCLQAKYVTREAFDPVRKIVYGMVAVMLIAVISAVLALVVRGV